MKAITSFTDSVGLFAKTYHYLQKSKHPEASVEDLKLQWAKDMLSRLRIDLEISGKVSEQKSLLFLGNHVSYLDVPLLMSTVRGLSFVAKEEVRSWPVIGSAAKKIETVFEIAHEKNLLFQPFRITYLPLRAAAYIDDDFLPTHLFNLFGLERIHAKLEFHDPVRIKDPVVDCEYWQNWTKSFVTARQN